MSPGDVHIPSRRTATWRGWSTAREVELSLTVLRRQLALPERRALRQQPERPPCLLPGLLAHSGLPCDLVARFFPEAL